MNEDQPADQEFLSLFARLAAPFSQDEVKVRSQSGKQIQYITARVVMNRLDDVVGPRNWWDRYQHASEHSVVCELSIRLPNGEILTKVDAGGYAGMADPGDDDKSGYADGLKRAAVKFGIGRYLYRDGIPLFAREILRGHGYGAPEPGPMPQEYEEPPQPTQRQPASQPVRQDRQDGNVGRGGDGQAPRTGRALFAWTKDQDEKYEFGLLRHLNTWSKRQDFPPRMVDWDDGQVAAGYAEGCRRIKAIQTGEQQAQAMTN